jgi:glycosyltransferase involved in cell wall biosynthesis
MPADNDIRRSNGLSGKFVVLYIGAHGISHALHTVLDSAALTADDDDIRWVFVGEGAAKKALVQSARERGLRNVLFVPGQPRAMMPEWYAAADAALVPLRNIGMFETFIPSKMFEIMACGRPIVASVKGEARDILQASGAAVIVDPEDSAAVAEAVLTLKRDAQLRARLSASGRHFALAHYDRRELARQYLELLSGVVRSRAAVPTT